MESKTPDLSLGGEDSQGKPGIDIHDSSNGTPGSSSDAMGERPQPLIETMNGDASAGPAAATSATAESDDDNMADAEDSLLMPEDEVDHVCVGESGTQRTLVLQNSNPDELSSMQNEEDPPDDEMEHTAPKQSRDCLRNGLSAVGCEGRFKVDMDSASPCPMRGPALRDPKAESGDEKFLAPCPGLGAKGDEAENEKKGDSRTSPRPNKRRTWKYYPPPTNDTDKVPIDVIDHESEVLIIRREPPPPPKGTCNITASSFCQS